MKLLEDRVKKDGKILPGGVLKIDGFLNHQIDAALCYEMALELKRLYEGEEINKILTVESSGIAFAVMTAYLFGCPMVYAKKSKSSNISNDVWKTEVASFTHGNVNTVMVSKEYLGEGDRVLIVDDFLATGAALKGLREIVRQAGATVVGAGISVEKVFQGGGNELRAQGMRIESLAKVASMSDDSIEFC